MAELLFKDEVYSIIGAVMEVHSVLGSGFLEPVYPEALEVEFHKRKIPFTPQKQLKIAYKDVVLKKSYIADYVVFDKIVIEIKAINHLSSVEESQLLNYMKAGGYELGLLINFGAESLKWKRMILSDKGKFAKISEICGSKNYEH